MRGGAPPEAGTFPRRPRAPSTEPPHRMPQPTRHQHRHPWPWLARDLCCVWFTSQSESSDRGHGWVGTAWGSPFVLGSQARRAAAPLPHQSCGCTAQREEGTSPRSHSLLSLHEASPPNAPCVLAPVQALDAPPRTSGARTRPPLPSLTNSSVDTSPLTAPSRS